MQLSELLAIMIKQPKRYRIKMNLWICIVTILAILGSTKVHGKEVVCYVDTSSAGGYQLMHNIKPNLCTMIDLAFAQVDANGNILASKVPNLSNYLKFKGTDVAPRMLLSLGGAADWVSLANFVRISQSSELREAFAASCLKTCQEYGLSGIDVDWEFPEVKDKQNFVELLKAVKAKLEPAGYLLTIAVGASNWLAVGMGGLDIKAVGKVVDYIKLMTYDFHSNAQWDRSFGLYFNAPMDDASGRDSMVNSLRIFSSVHSSKLILGLPLYGNAYTISESVEVGAEYSLNWPSTGISPSYNQICTMKHMTRIQGSAPQWTPHMYDDNLWISYDDPSSVAKKSSLVNTKNLGGIMVWSMEKDDQTGACDICAFPLMRSINNAIGRLVDCSFTINGTSTPSTLPPVTTTPSGISSSSTSTTSSHTSSSSTSTMTSTTSGSSEVCSSIGYFKHPDDCTKYLQCVDVGARPYIRPCPTGLFWNDQMKYCDWNCVE